MARKKTQRISLQLHYSLLVVFLSLVLIQHAQVIQAQTNAPNNQWALSLQFQGTGQNSTNAFTPFDKIQLTARVTYGDATQPDILVTFKVQGPSSVANPTNMTTVATTNATGQAESTFRLPTETLNQDSPIGTWQAIASIRTNNGTLQKSLCFMSRWMLQITSLSIENSQGHNQTILYPGNEVTVGLNLHNSGPSQSANITLTMHDASGKTANETQIENVQVTNGTNQLQATLEIPSNAPEGEASITAAIFSGTYQNTWIPAGENQTSYFTIVGNGKTNSSPSPSPSKTPNVTENAVSLFSWLLIATGLFTFTALYMFLRRKPAKIGAQIPSIPTIEAKITASAPIGESDMQQKMPHATVIHAEAEVMSEKTAQATTTDIPGNSQGQEEEANINKATMESASLEYGSTAESSLIAEMGKASGVELTARKIEVIKALLDLENEQFEQDLAEFNRATEQRISFTRGLETTNRTGKTRNYQTQEESDGLNMLSRWQGRIHRMIKRIESLRLALKLEKEQFDEDFENIKNQVDERERIVRNRFQAISQEVERLKKSLQDNEK